MRKSSSGYRLRQVLWIAGFCALLVCYGWLVAHANPEDELYEDPPAPATTASEDAALPPLIKVEVGEVIGYLLPPARTGVHDGWDVEPEQIRQFERELGVLRLGLTGHLRRYAGIMRGVRRVMHVQLICETESEWGRWHGSAFLEASGGACVKTALFDVATGKIMTVEANPPGGYMLYPIRQEPPDR